MHKPGLTYPELAANWPEVARQYAAWRDYLRIERNYRASTLDSYSSRVLRFLSWLAEAHPGQLSAIGGVTRDHIAGFLKHSFYRGVKGSARGTSLSAIKSFFGRLADSGLIPSSPAEGISSPRVIRRVPSKFSTEELSIIFSAPDITRTLGLRDKALLMTAYACALRISEVQGLDMADIADGGRVIRVLVRGKGGKERSLSMSSAPSAALRAWLVLRASMDTPDEQALFIGRGGTRLSVVGIERILKKYARGLPVKAFMHKLRATCLSDLYDMGRDRCTHCGKPVQVYDIYTISAFAGHENIETIRRYINQSRRAQRMRLPERRFNEIARGIPQPEEEGQ